MIERQDIMGLLVGACPSFAPRWAEGSRDDFLDTDGNRLIYVALGDFARHLVQLALAGQVEEFAAVFEIVERLHIEGDDWVREAATVGLLEGIQNHASHTSLDQAFFEPYLRPESRKWWDSLDGFWAGKNPIVAVASGKPQYQAFDDLPNHIKAWLLRRIAPKDPDRWSRQPIPALENQSVLEVMNGPDGERRIIDYLQRLPDWGGEEGPSR